MRAFLLPRLAAFALPLCLGSCSDPAPLGAVMLAMQTDMALPDDVSEVSLVVRSEDEATFGRILHEETLLTYDTATGRYVRFPATFAVVEGEEPNRRVRIRLAAYDRLGNAIVLNEAVTIVPHERVALLRLPLQFLAQTSVKAGNRNDPDGVVSSCPNVGEVEVAGLCRSPEIDSSKLPDYEPALVFGGGDGSEGSGECFAIPTCFDGFEPIGFDATTCSAPLPTNASFNLAILRTEKASALGPATAGAMCIGEDCLIPIDEDPDYGWRRSADGTRIEFSRAICDPRNVDRIADIVGSGVCAAKTLATPICAPWSASSETQSAPIGSPGLDTQTVTPTPFGTPERMGLIEPAGIRALVLRDAWAYALTASVGDAMPSNDGRAKMLRIDKANPAAIPALAFAPDPDDDMAPNTGYRLAFGDNFLAMVDVSPTVAASFPSKAYIVHAYDTQPAVTPITAFSGGIVRAMASSFPDVYWVVDTSGSQSLFTSALPMPETPSFVETALPTDVTALAADLGVLVFGSSAGITRCVPADMTCAMDAPTVLGAGQPPISIAFDATDVFVIDYGTTGHLYRFPKSLKGMPVQPVRDIGDTRFVPVGQALSTGTPFEVAVDDDYVYYTDAAGLHYLPKSDLTAPPGTIDGATRTIRGIALDPVHVYYGVLEGDEPAVYRVEKRGQGM